MAGLHIVKKPLKLLDRYYVYAWRGGPCIHSQDGRPPVITPDILAKQQTAKAALYGESRDSFNALIRGYQASPEYARLVDRTKTDYRLWLTRASAQFGNTPIGAFEDRRMRGDIITWRNLWQDQPRTADKAIAIMSLILAWGLENGWLRINIATGIKQLYEADRADQIWEPKHWVQFGLALPPPQLTRAIHVARWTGLRLTDLCGLQWDNVQLSRGAIIVMTSKGKRKNARAVIPILPELKAWIATIPEAERTGAVLKNSLGKPWTPGGLEATFQRKKPEGFERRIHDLRGSFCTMLILKGLTDDQCAMVMGWTSKRVAAIRARYVDEAAVIISLAEKLSR